MKHLKKAVIMILAIAVMVSCFSFPVLAFNQTNGEEPETNNNSELVRAPEYIRIKNTSAYNCYTTYGKTAAEGAPIACLLKSGDYLLFLDTKWDAQGRNWVKGQIQGSHACYGWYVWLLYDSYYMSISY